jgi:hypothetical protein
MPKWDGIRNRGDKRAVVERLSIPEPNTGCWLWTRKDSAYGYCRLSYEGKVFSAHRFSWEAFRGPIPEGMVIDHICRVRSCVNPDHLRVVTPTQNTMENSLGVGALNAKKECCTICGEPLRCVNWQGRVKRDCRPCRNRRRREIRQSGRWRERETVAAREWREKNREHSNKWSRDYRQRRKAEGRPIKG